MKRILALAMAVLLLAVATAMAESIDLTTYTDEQLEQLQSAIIVEQAAREEAAQEAEVDAEEMGKIIDEPVTVETVNEEAPAAEEVAAEEAPAEAAPAAEEVVAEEVTPVFETIAKGSISDKVVALQGKLKELGYNIGATDGIFGDRTEAALKALQTALGWEQTGEIAYAEMLDEILALEPGDGVNLVVDASGDWSEWMTPEANAQNKTFNIAHASLPAEKQVGDAYSCQIEIEFADVTATEGGEDQKFGFWTQGKVDDSWDIVNIWTPKLVKLDAAPQNSVYQFVSTEFITEKNVNAVMFNIGFRCDYWASGSFRVRNIKVEKGYVPTIWTPAP